MSAFHETSATSKQQSQVARSAAEDKAAEVTAPDHLGPHMCAEERAVTQQDDVARKRQKFLAIPILCATAVLLCCQHDVAIRQMILLP